MRERSVEEEFGDGWAERLKDGYDEMELRFCQRVVKLC